MAAAEIMPDLANSVSIVSKLRRGHSASRAAGTLLCGGGVGSEPLLGVCFGHSCSSREGGNGCGLNGSGLSVEKLIFFNKNVHVQNEKR